MIRVLTYPTPKVSRVFHHVQIAYIIEVAFYLTRRSPKCEIGEIAKIGKIAKIGEIGEIGKNLSIQ